MRTIITTGTDDITVVDRPTPEPGDREVRIEVSAAAVNPVDVATGQGVFHRLGIIPAGRAVGLGWDVSGIVDALGPGVRGLDLRTPVAGLRTGIGPRIGTYGEYLLLPADAVAPVPDDLDLAAAASIGLIAHTASQAIDLLDPAGSRLLIVGASGGVGSHAVALAARAGATVSAVGKAGDHDELRHLGADTVVTDPAAIAGDRFDAVFDPAGVGARLLDLIVDHGRYLGTAPGAAPSATRGISSTWVEVRADGRELARLLGDVAAGLLPLRVAGEFPLDEADRAHKAFTARSAPGRWLVRP